MCRYACMIAVYLISLTFLQHLVAAEVPKATELLDRYAETQNKFKSYIIKTHDLYTGSDWTGPARREEQTEVRYDGNRFYKRMESWGDTGPGHVTKDKPYYNTNLYDGQKIYFHSQAYGGNQPDIVNINQEPGTRVSELVQTSGDQLQGKNYGDFQSIDTLFRDPNSIVAVREKPERVGGSDCYVIEAKTSRGQYTVWIDPEHGYNIAKSKMSKSGKDILFDKPIAEMTPADPKVRFVSLSESVKDVRFEKIGDTWVPMEGTIENVTSFSNGTKSVTKQEHKRTEVILNPDHDALGSFVPNFPNGSTVRILGVPRVRYLWQDGKFLPELDQKALDAVTETIDSEKAIRTNSQPAKPQVVKVKVATEPQVSTVPDNQPAPAVTVHPSPGKGTALIAVGLLAVLVFILYRRIRNA